jgi:predicted secreted protein
MAISTAVAVYFLIWWIVLFAVLPWGVRAQSEEGTVPGSDPGAPAVPNLWAKLIWTTVVAAVAWGIVALIYLNGWLTIDGLAGVFAFPQNQ